MAEEVVDPWEAIPPEWVTLTEVPSWIQRRFGMPGDPVVPDLVIAVRSGRLRYRVADLLPRSSVKGTIYPPGLSSSGGPGSDLIVQDWSAAAFDVRTGTIAGWKTASGNPARHSIEVWWASIEEWSPLYLAPLKFRLKARASVAASASTDAAPPKKKNPGGRPTTHDWETFWMEVAHWIDSNGTDPDHRRELQKHMEDYTAEKMDPPPGEAAIRVKLRRLYEYLGERNRG